MRACPANADRVLPSDSYFGQVTIIPTKPSLDVLEIGQASFPVAGLIVPAKELDTGIPNIS